MAHSVEEVKGPSGGGEGKTAEVPWAQSPGRALWSLEEAGRGLGPAFDCPFRMINQPQSWGISWTEDCFSHFLLKPPSFSPAAGFPFHFHGENRSLQKGTSTGAHPAATQHRWPWFMPSLWPLGVPGASPLPGHASPCSDLAITCCVQEHGPTRLQPPPSAGLPASSSPSLSPLQPHSTSLQGHWQEAAMQAGPVVSPGLHLLATLATNACSTRPPPSPLFQLLVLPPSLMNFGFPRTRSLAPPA